ncbi:hypothetical protein [Paraburkholderia sp. PGU19]|nr:hypothetical protein [Paraburkholderia sp. PGU19]
MTKSILFNFAQAFHANADQPLDRSPARRPSRTDFGAFRGSLRV